MEKRGVTEVIKSLNTPIGTMSYYDISELEEIGYVKDLWKMPYCVRMLLENVVRNYDGVLIDDSVIRSFDKWRIDRDLSGIEVPLFPTRILLQDFTGIPLIVDLAAMRDAVKKIGINPSIINPKIPTHLVIDHSLSVDFFGSPDAYRYNIEVEYKRNRERYIFLKWAQSAFDNLRVIPPGKGIIHQVNIEHLTKVIDFKQTERGFIMFPEIVLGTDSHTTMVNGLGVLGWGVGGIEAEAALLGLPYPLSFSEVVGVRLVGEMPKNVTATDLALTITESLRSQDLVGKFVEFFGPGVKSLRVPDRTTISNMAPEYGATIGFFPIDSSTMDYLLQTGRTPELVKSIEIYCREVGFFLDDHDSESISYSKIIDIDLSSIEPSVSGPANPEDRIPLSQVKKIILEHIRNYRSRIKEPRTRSVGGVKINIDGRESVIDDGAVVIAAITSCANTSNPSLMIGAGLIAKKAFELGLSVKPHVKTSLAPGSRVVTEYLRHSGLLQYLEKLGFHIVGYGCTTCIGNSGPLIREVAEAVDKEKLYTCAVISGNRNFEGRIHPQVRGCFLASPILVVAYAIAGKLDIDLLNEPLSYIDSKPVYLRDIWPSPEEIERIKRNLVSPEKFIKIYSDVFKGDELWESLPAPTGLVFQWDDTSTYIKRPPFLDEFKLTTDRPSDIRGARVLVLLGDRVTTDHISPAGAIHIDSPAGAYLRSLGVDPTDFNTYGARRGNHEVMERGTFSNIHLKNYLLPDSEGWWTVHMPSGEKMTIFDAAQRYKKEGTPLIIIAGKQYGAGSSRDWAAKGVKLLGVRAVIAESFERIHRSNLICMGVLPLQFEPNEGWRELGLSGKELYEIQGISDGLSPRKKLRVIARNNEGEITFNVTAMLNNHAEVEYFNNGGVLPYVLRQLLKMNA